MTPQQLQKMIPTNQYVSDWFEILQQYLPNYDIIGINREAMFVAQCGHESSDFNRLKENLNYKAETLMKVWPNRFPTLEFAKKYEHNQVAIANYVYANRMGNGSEESGDGWKFCGRGLIQLTGREMYEKFSDEENLELDDVPEYLTSFEGAVHSACWFWKLRNINPHCDTGNVELVTKLINGGYNGLEERKARYEKAVIILNAP